MGFTVVDPPAAHVAGSEDELNAHLSPPAPSKFSVEEPPAQTEEPGDDLYRQEGGMSLNEAKAETRGAAHAVLGLPELAANIGGGIANKFNRNNPQRIEDIGSTGVDKVLDALGLETDKSVGARALEMASTLAGAPYGGVGAGSALKHAKALDDVTAGTVGLRGWSQGAGSASPLNQKTLNNLWGQAIGEPGITKLTRDVANAADDRIGKVFDLARNAKTAWYFGGPKQILDELRVAVQPYEGSFDVVASSPAMRRLMTAVGGAGRTLRDATGAVISDSRTAANRMVSSQDLGQISTDLRAEMEDAYDKSQYTVGRSLKAARQWIEDKIESQLDPAMRGTYQKAKSQYRALMQLVDGPSGNWHPGSGDVNGTAMSRFLQRTDKPGYAKARTPAMPAHYQATALASMDDASQALMDNVKGVAKAAGALPAPVVSALRVFPLARQWAMTKSFEHGKAALDGIHNVVANYITPKSAAAYNALSGNVEPRALAGGGEEQ